MVLQIAGLIVLAWLVLAVLVGFGWARFMRNAHRLEAALPTDEQDIADWVRAGQNEDIVRRGRARRRAA
jgi:hypothetical protein